MLLTHLLQMSTTCCSSDLTEIFQILGLPLPTELQILLVSRVLQDPVVQFSYSDVMLYMACTLDTSISTSLEASSGHDRYDFFLGGACNPTTWRKDVAIPILDRLGLTYYNPQVDDWSPGLMELEREAKSLSNILLFVFENWKTRGLVSLLEATYLASQRKPLVLCISKTEESNLPSVAGENITKLEYHFLEEAMSYFVRMVKRLNIPCFSEVKTAIHFAVHNSHLRFKLSENMTYKDKQLLNKILFVSNVLNGIIRRTPKSADSQAVYEQIRQGFKSLNVDLTTDRSFIDYWDKIHRFDLLSSLYAEHVMKQSSSSLLARFEMYLSAKFLSNCDKHKCFVGDQFVNSSSGTESYHYSVESPLIKQSFDSQLSPCFLDDSSYTSISSGAGAQSLSCRSSLLPKSNIHMCLKDIQPSKNALTDIYIAGILTGNKFSQSLMDNFILPKLTNANLSYYQAVQNDFHAPSDDNKILLQSYQDLENKQLETLHNCRVLLYIIDNTSFHLVTLMEAAYSMGCHLPVVLFIQLFNSPDETNVNCCHIPHKKCEPNSLQEFMYDDCKMRQFYVDSFVNVNTKSSTNSSGVLSDFTGTNSSVFDEQLSVRSNSLEYGIMTDLHHYTKHSTDNLLNNSTSIPSQSHGNILMSISQEAIKDYNRVRMYLIDLAQELNIPVVYDIEAAINLCIFKLTEHI
ncbi:hypothetical protein MN116_003179 [Schistosoma mekongi]|uniref:Raw n=1 Tax=Schistosoma mekongi TaxID=38744 RepID=A0AAE2D7B9_SCHME|nr:hypothetical protein MN116_003179 [Schistosoma mekongi]